MEQQRKLQFYLMILLEIIAVTVGAPEPHHRDPVVDPALAFLKALRKARKHSGGSGLSILGGIKEEGSGGSSEEQRVPLNIGSASHQSPSVPILFPSGGGGGGSFPSSSSSGNRDQQISISFPSGSVPIQQSRPQQISLPPIPTPRPTGPEDIQRINNGVSTILAGVRDFDLGQILRGAFIFPAHNNVRSVANNVIDSIFGPPGGFPAQGGGGGGGGDQDTRRRP